MMHKGLVLVAVPLIFGSVFISLLCFGLSNLEHMVQREHMLKDAISCHMTALRCAAAAKRLASEYRFTNDPKYNTSATGIAQVRKAIWKSRLEQVISEYSKEAASFDQHIFNLLKNEPALLSSAQKSSSLQLVKESSSGYAADTHFLHELLKESAIQTQAATNAMSSLRATLFGGMAIGLLISGVLTLFFCLNITNRLLIILQHTLSLSRGNSLSPPLEGEDEISELDQFLFKSANEIRELERFKQEMIGVVSHELKSPLSSVGGFLSSLSAGVYGVLAPKAQEKVERTSKTVKRLMVLIQDLLYLDRLELEMKPVEIDIDELVAGSVDSVRELSTQSGIEIIVKSYGGKVYADRDRLVQVIVNLLSNAMKFSPEKGQVTIETQLAERWFTCRISDQGRGIPEAFRKQIFDPFKQVDATDATSKKGTGLGLTISRSIVEQHGGTIGVDSEEGKGSTFWFKIPATAAALDQAVSGMHSLQALGQSSANLPVQTPPVMKGSEGSKFKVLHKGVVIIAVPVIFQFSFFFLILHSLDQISQQLRREENSTEILNTLNHGAELYYSAMYAFSKKDPSSWRRCLDDQEKVFGVLDKVEKLCSGDAVELKESNESRRCLKLFYASTKQRLEDAAKTGETNPVQPQSTSDPETVKEIYPLFEAQRAEERLMLREREIGESLGAQRVQMINELGDTLLRGILINFVLSLFLAIFLMRSLSNRLKHVMQNTGRLVRREALDPPLSGGDEIAYLDKVLYETGNHLLELEKFKQELISIVSHELRTPLMSISAALELFQADALGQLSEKGKIRLGIAEEEASRLIRLINDLLDIEKMEAGKFILDNSEFRVADLVETSIASVAQPAEVKEITLQAQINDPDLRLHGDRDRLCQVLINLLSNAIKFSPENESITIRVDSSENNQLKFSVIDRGRGIPKEKLDKVFGRFVQVEKSDETKRGGSGLGLAISKAIIEQHGGSMGVESEMGVGSTFWFKLPAKIESLAVVR